MLRRRPLDRRGPTPNIAQHSPCTMQQPMPLETQILAPSYTHAVIRTLGQTLKATLWDIEMILGDLEGSLDDIGEPGRDYKGGVGAFGVGACGMIAKQYRSLPKIR